MADDAHLEEANHSLVEPLGGFRRAFLVHGRHGGLERALDTAGAVNVSISFLGNDATRKSLHVVENEQRARTGGAGP